MINFEQGLSILNNNISDEYFQVEDLLNEASKSYYNTSELILSDTEYDELLKLYELVTGKTIIGAEPDSTKGTISVSHKYKNLTGTLTKNNSIDDFLDWYVDIIDKLNLTDESELPALLLTLKFDGNSVAIEYKNGKVVKALTRGKDGMGVDLTDLFKNDTINYKKPCGIKYEVIVVDEDFKKLCEVMDKDYANARSTVSGLLGRDDKADFRDYLTLVPLEIRYENNIKTREDSLEDIEVYFGEDSLIFEDALIISDENSTISDIVDSVNEYYIDINKKRFDYPFMIDGIVIEILDEDFRTELGYDSVGRPNYATALKFPYAEKVTEVTGIDFCYGDSGRITPRVWFKQIEFLGNKQNKQNLHNYKRFKELGLGIGSKILVEYRNEVLTYVNKLNTPENEKITPIPFITECPVCHEESIKIVVNDKGEETFAYCSNPYCDGKIIGSLQNYVTKMGIKGIKENTFKKIKEYGLVKSITDLYTMDYSQISNISGLGTKIAEMFKTKFADDRNEYFDYQILGSVGIINISQSNAKLFCTYFKLNDVLNDYTTDGNLNKYYNKVIGIKGFSKIQTKYLLEGIIENIYILRFLIYKLKVKSYKNAVDANKDDVSLKIVFTGFRNPDYQSKLELKGHKVTSSVSSKTNLVVAANPNDTTVKIKKAIENGIEVISVDELVKRFNL